MKKSTKSFQIEIEEDTFVVDRYASDGGPETEPYVRDLLKIRDSDGDTIFELPGWIHDAGVEEILRIIFKARDQGISVGKQIGAIEEKNRIVYGFRAVLQPVIDCVIENAGVPK